MDTGAAADLIAVGNAGLDRGDWASAKTAFESALSQAETAEALDGLGQALWWLNDLHTAIELREHAYAEFRARGELRRAGRIAVWLGRDYFTVHGNFAAAGGWLQRAEHLLNEAGRCPEQGWLTLVKAFIAEDPAVRQLLANEVIELAKSLGHRPRDRRCERAGAGTGVRGTCERGHGATRRSHGRRHRGRDQEHVGDLRHLLQHPARLRASR